MPAKARDVKYLKSPLQAPYALKDAFSWGTFVRYLELGEDSFALRQVDEYENGFLTRYDRDHWQDQFGSLADFRWGESWIAHWGEPSLVSKDSFEEKWAAAELSKPFAIRHTLPSGRPPWIVLFESGKWRGQA